MAELPKQMTKEEQEDLEKRVEGCNADVIPILGKWKVGLGAQAFLNPNGTIGARAVYMDATQLMEDDKKGKEQSKVAEG